MKREMQKIISGLTALLLVLGLCACGQKAAVEETQNTPTWQEQYDLGVRYLSEGNYEEAIIAFTAAIEIDLKISDGYLKLAEVYIELDAPEQAAQALYDGWKNCPVDTQVFEDALQELGYRIDKDGVLVSLQELEESAFSAYQEILDTIYYGILSKWAEFDYESPPEMISYMWYYYWGPVQSLSDAGYALLDLNDDAIPELITSVVSDDDVSYDNWGSAGGMIYDLYTYHDGDIIHLTSSGERDRYYLCENSIISNEGSNGASDSWVGFYELLPDSTALHMMEGVRFCDGGPYYCSEKMFMTFKRWVHITEEAAERILSKYTRTSLVLTPFDRYTPDE